MIRRAVIVAVAAVWVFITHAAPLFHTALHARIATAVELELPDSIGVEACIDSAGIYDGHVLRVRTNVLGDVSHIGYRLFANDMVAAHGASPVFDFIERYALELDLQLDGRMQTDRMCIDKVVCGSGDISMLAHITPAMPFSLEEIERRMYRVRWTLPSGKLSLTIPADCQLLKGGNAVELEDIFERDVQRMPLIPEKDIIADWSQAKVSRSGTFLIAEGEDYLSSAIRSDLYLQEEKKGHLRLVADKANPILSVRNILLTGLTSGLVEGEIPVELTIDHYGNKRTKVDVSYRQIVNYMQSEGCRMFLGIKTRTDSHITATLFAFNKAMAYNHVLSIDFPLSLLNTGEGEIKAILYAYIPLQNVTEKFFIQDIKDYNQ